MPHLWESNEDNACCALSDALRLFEFHSWDLFLTGFGNKEFTGPLLWHYWSTPASDCEFCTDQAYCEEDSCQERYGNPVPSKNNQLWLLRTLRAGGPYLVIVDVKRSDEPNIREWLLRKYRKRSLLSEFLP